MHHKVREEEEHALDVFNLRKITDSESSIAVTFQHAGLFLRDVRTVLDTALEGLITNDRLKLKEARLGQRKIQQSSNIIAANIFKVLRLLQRESVEDTHRYAQTISALQEISESLRDVVMRSYTHVSNNHSGFLEGQVAEIGTVRDYISRILDDASEALSRRQPLDMEVERKLKKKLKKLVKEIDQNQIMRIQDNSSKTRLSILFYSLTWDCVKIAEHTYNLLTVFQEPLGVGLADADE
jgi:Na+/phosphate symporter